MTSAILYARYSTHLQSATSVEDQFALLRQRAQREGWPILAEHGDHAISGTVRARPGLDAALSRLQPGMILLAEALDRISRDQEDLAAIYKRVRFRGARIVTLSEGEVGTMHIGMGSTMSAVMLEQLGDKTRRGQIGRVKAGRIPGGKSYGYRIVRSLDASGEVERGLRAIDEEQAAIIRRIFAGYAAGVGPRAIAQALNHEGIPAPRGGPWRAATILGNKARQNGILHNALYRGVIVYNRQSFRKDPDSRKRVSRVNDPADLVETHVPDLQIVDDALWTAAHARLDAVDPERPWAARRARRPLSGMIRCGACGSSYTIKTRDTWGCSAHKETGTCANNRTVSNTKAEARIWAAIRTHLLHPEAVQAYVDEFRRAMADARREQVRARNGIDRRLAELDQEEERIADAIIAGIALDRVRARADLIVQEREGLKAQLAAFDQDEQLVLHGALAQGYARRVETLRAVMEGGDEARAQAFALIRELIVKIEATPRADGQPGVDLVLHGDLAALLRAETDNAKRPADSSTGPSSAVTPFAGPTAKLVAGAGFGLCSGLIRIAA